MAGATKQKRANIEEVLVEEAYPEGRVVARVRMRRDPNDGTLSYAASAIRTLDRLRALAQDVHPVSSPGHIRMLRESLGLTQQELAHQLSVSSQTISRWERGQSRPNADAVRRLRRLQSKAKRDGIAVRDETVAS